MPRTQVVHSRIDEPDLVQARGAHPELAELDTSRLLRVALAYLAGRPLVEAIESSTGGKRGPKPKAERERAEAAA